MKKLSSKILLASMVALGFFVASCNNSTSTTNTSTTNADSMKKMTDTTKTATPAGKVAEGTDVTIHCVGNNMSEMHYDVSEIHTTANTKMKITLVDDATDPSMQHNIVIVKAADMDSVAMHGISAGLAKGFVPDEASVIAASKLTQPGTKTVLEFTTPAAGDYMFICTYPGHYQKMNGKFIVK